MFGWFRRQEGFEWREYVRTTVLVRRRDRQRRMDDAREAALGKVRLARDKGVEAGLAGLSFAGEQAARAKVGVGRALLGLSAAVGSAVATLAGTAGKLLGRSVREKTEKLTRRHRPAQEKQRDDAPGGEVQDQSRISFGSAIAEQWRVVVQAAGPLRQALAGSPVRPRHVIWAAAGVGTILIFGPMLRGELPSSPFGLTGEGGDGPAARGVSVEFGGASRAVRGDRLRIAGRNVDLAWIEAPPEGLPCLSAKGRPWRCAAAAKSALARLVRRRSVACKTVPAGSGTGIVASCMSGEIDVALDLVRGGHVFAADTAPSEYRDAEQAARQARVGIWKGDVTRPEAWRAQLWKQAEAAAPDGCPIKGAKQSGTYLLPWSQGYANARVRPERGDKWFCSESDAREAGLTDADLR